MERCGQFSSSKLAMKALFSPTMFVSFQATIGKLKMVCDEFNIEFNKSCKKKDYLYVGPTEKFGTVSSNHLTI